MKLLSSYVRYFDKYVCDFWGHVYYCVQYFYTTISFVCFPYFIFKYSGPECLQVQT